MNKAMRMLMLSDKDAREKFDTSSYNKGSRDGTRNYDIGIYTDKSMTDKEPKEFTSHMANKWAKKLENSDGTTGAHWTKEQTTSVAKKSGIKFDDFTEDAFWIAMNAMYADYYNTAKKYNVNLPEFYACMAEDFLNDEDAKGGAMNKLMNYYEYIVD